MLNSLELNQSSVRIQTIHILTFSKSTNYINIDMWNTPINISTDFLKILEYPTFVIYLINYLGQIYKEIIITTKELSRFDPQMFWYFDSGTLLLNMY